VEVKNGAVAVDHQFRRSYFSHKIIFSKVRFIFIFLHQVSFYHYIYASTISNSALIDCTYLFGITDLATPCIPPSKHKNLLFRDAANPHH
jgi:hypothetical protein